MPGGLTLTEQTVALYAASNLENGTDISTLIAEGVRALGGAESVRRRAEAWLSLNDILLRGTIADREWRRLVALWWPDSDRLDRCNALVFAHAMTSPRR